MNNSIKVKNIWETCLDFIKTEDTRRNLKEKIMNPMGELLYNEIYVYIWFICFYHVFLIFIILANLLLLLWILQKMTIPVSQMYLNRTY
jgi:hypothetical protein